MSEKVENNAIIHQRKRRKHKIKLLTISLCLMIIGAVTIYGYFKLTKNQPMCSIRILSKLETST